MATINNVLLSIDHDPASPKAKAKVSYTLRGSLPDVQHPHRYRESVQLIGVDEGPGEDGVNDIIVGGLVFSGTVGFANTNAINRSRVLELPDANINEDTGLASPFPLPKRDEIRAVVTLTQIAGAPVSAKSNDVKFGGIQLP